MSNPLNELKRILAPDSIAETGRVVSLGQNIGVSTRTGLKSVTSTIALSLGDSVLICNGAVQTKVRDQSELPIYYL